METMMAASDGHQLEAAARYGKREQHQQQAAAAAGGECGAGHRHCFQMPLHYPRYSREDYEAMPEWQLDRLLSEYGLPATGTIHQKRAFAMGTFLWGDGEGNHY